MSKLADMLKSRFIVIDGPDGAGKTTQMDMLQSFAESLGLSVVRTFDPGGTVIGQKIREILLEQEDLPINSMCETLLFMASRAQLAEEIIKPGVSNGNLVLCDRFISATIAYQGALGVKPSRIIQLARHAVGDLWPDLTIILNISPEKAAERMGQQLDRVELRSGQYRDNVRDIFLKLQEIYPTPVRYLCGEGTPQEVHKDICRVLEEHFDNT